MNEENSKNLVAIIGMAGKFPKAHNIHEFWSNLVEGRDCISKFTTEELIEAGESTELIAHPDYVAAKGILKDSLSFDASFFGYSPAEAATIDPQQRLFLETCWSALEDGAAIKYRSSVPIGVFGSASMSTYLLDCMAKDPSINTRYDSFQLLLGNDKDFLTTRVSFKLNLTGPSIVVQTACSSSLTATHLACQSLKDGECDLALAGGVSLNFPQKKGYLFKQGMVLSPDGKCRPFDDNAKGTVEGTGVGVVLLKRLEDALEDGDHIYAVIHGTACNNDGVEKIGYTAPSLDGQAAVINETLQYAGIHPENITYIEAHGTGTPLGDPIEISALSRAFSEQTAKTGFCAIGSVKSNIGHLNAAAGIASLIKVALSIKNKMLPASINFSKPNQKINFENTPFYVNKELKDWEQSKGTARFAGLSSFGIGGTNVHMILSESPTNRSLAEKNRRQIVPVSAKSANSVTNYCKALRDYIDQNPKTSIMDLAYSLGTGREEFDKRIAFVASSTTELLSKLESAHDVKTVSMDSKKVVWLFSGQGSQFEGMALELYVHQDIFREELDSCIGKLPASAPLKLIKKQLFGGTDEASLSSSHSYGTEIVQPALFIFEYSLAKMLQRLGMNADSYAGHSLGEFVAATLSGVFSLEDALRIVTQRGRLMATLKDGAMLAVYSNDQFVKELQSKFPKIDIAAINGSENSVFSGPSSEIQRLAKYCIECSVRHNLLNTNFAFHSRMVEPIMGDFEKAFDNIKLSSPKTEIFSNLTGQRADDLLMTNSDYWVDHLRKPVLFHEMIKNSLKDSDNIFVEIGPGNTLTSIVKSTFQSQKALCLLPHVRSTVNQEEHFLETLSSLWQEGNSLDWSVFHKNSEKKIISIPTYQFERTEYSMLDVREKPEKALSNASSNEGLANPKLETIEPESELELIIRQVWQNIFEIRAIGCTDNFMNLGGNSLIAIQMLSQIKKHLGVEVLISDFFENPTIRHLANIILEKMEELSEEELSLVDESLNEILGTLGR